MQPRDDDPNTKQTDELSFDSQPTTSMESDTTDGESVQVTNNSTTPTEPESTEPNTTWGDVSAVESETETEPTSFNNGAAIEPEQTAPVSAPTPEPTSAFQPASSSDTGMIPPMAPQTGGKSHKGAIILTIILVLLLAAGGAAYWFWLRPEDKTDSTDNRQTEQTQNENTEEEDLPPVDSDLTIIALDNKVVEDTEMGYKVTVTRMVPNFPVTNTNWSSANEAVLVEFKVETTGKFNGAPGDGNLRLIADNNLGSLTTALISDDEIKAQGFTPFPDAKATKDEPAIGFLAFAVPKGAQVLTVRYERMAATNISTGETIPAKNFDVVLN